MVAVGIDKDIVLYIKYNNKNILSLNSFIKYFKDNKINYVVMKEGGIFLFENFDNGMNYLNYYYKAIAFKVLKTIKNRVCM